MFAVIQILEFPLVALLRFNPSLRGEPIGILEGEGRRATVLYASATAHAVQPGMTAAQALAECPALQLWAPSLVAEREAGGLLLSAGWTLSPLVEATAPGLCTVDLQGANRAQLADKISVMRRQLSEHGLSCKVGVGPNALLARYAAHMAEPECWVTDIKSFLAPLPLRILEMTESEERLFADLGVRTLGALTRFPRAAITNRLGVRGDQLWARAAGEWNTPIQPACPPQRFLAESELEEAVEKLEPLLFLLRRFCDRLAQEVGQFGNGTSRVALVLKLDDEKTYAREFDLPEPTANPETIFAALENHLASLQTDAPIVGLSLEVFPVRRLTQQEGLFDTGLKDAPMFFATLSRLAAVVGNGNVGTPKRLDTHRPDSVTVTTPLVSVPERQIVPRPPDHGLLLRRLRPPVSATVELTEARPSFLFSTMAKGEVEVLRRPFRANGNWWDGEWKREEWDVRIGPGLFRLLHIPEGWFIEGIYD